MDVNVPVRLSESGRLWHPDWEHAQLSASQQFSTRLYADHIRNGRVIEKYDFGSGVVTLGGSKMLAALMGGSLGAGSGLIGKLLAYQGSGVGSTAASKFQNALITGIAGTPSTPSAASVSFTAGAQDGKATATCTIAYGTSQTIAEWGSFTDNAAYSVAAGNTAATIDTTHTNTGSVTIGANAWEGFIATVATDNVWGLILANTSASGAASTLTVDGWWANADGTLASNPASGHAITITPVMWDRKVLSVTVTGGTDSIAYTYVLTLPAGS